MRSIVSLAPAALLMALCCAGIASAQVFEILAFGDSITQGKKRDGDGVISGIIDPPNGARTLDGYEPELENDFATQTDHTAYVYNWGFGGERTYQGVNRIDSVLDSRQADIILIMEGANDLASGVSASTTKANLRIMIQKSKAKDTKPILATVTPNTNRSDGHIIPNNYNPAIKALASEEGIVLADQYAALVGNWSAYNSGDGLHLNDDGERVMAQVWLDSISDAMTVSNNVFSPGFDDTSTWVVYKDKSVKDTKVMTFADGDAPGEKYKVVVKTTTGDTINYLFTGKASGYSGCDKSAYAGQWPGHRKIELGINAGFAKLLKMKMIRRSGTGLRNAYVGFNGSRDEGWTRVSGPADTCGWSAAYGSDDAIWIEKDETPIWQADLPDDGQPMLAMSDDSGGDDAQDWVDISATASGNVFSPRFDDTSTWVVYKDMDGKDTKVITFADAGSPGEKYKVVIKTTTGDTINYLFTGKGSGYTGCDKSAYAGQWPGYRKIVLGSNAGYAKSLKMKMVRRSGSGTRYAYVGFIGSGDEGWTQTSGPADGCGW